MGCDSLMLRGFFTVPEAPADVKVASTSSTAALVTWKKPHRSNGNIVKFTVYKRTTDRDKEVQMYSCAHEMFHSLISM